MAKSQKSVRVTNPKVAPNLPRPRGVSAASPQTPEPWRPVTITEGQQMKPSDRVKFTSEKASRSR